MTQTRIIIISLVAFFSVAEMNYAAAQFQCNTNDCLIARRDALLAQRREQEARQREEESRKREAQLKQRAIEERKIITCTPMQGNVQRCVQHGQGLF
jgi:hypothetical protein